MAKATALMRGGDFVIPEDVLAVIENVWVHRIHLNAKAKAEGMDAAQVIFELTERIHAV